MKFLHIFFLGSFFSLSAQDKPVLENQVQSIRSQPRGSKPFLQFVLKKNGELYYSYDSTDTQRSLLLIKQPTKKNLIQLLTDVEKKYQIKLTETEIFIKGDGNAEYEKFSNVMKALREKYLFKVRFIDTKETITGQLSSPKKEVKDDTIPISSKTLIIIIDAADQLYYYHGLSCEQLIKSSFKEINGVLRTENKNTALKDLFILIKETEGATFKNAIDLLDEIALNKIPPKHYAETEITLAELNCIKNFKKQ